MRWITLTLLLFVTGCCHITHVRVRVVCIQPVTGILEIDADFHKGD